MNDLNKHEMLTGLVDRSMPGESIVSTTLPLCDEINLYLVASSQPESKSIQDNLQQLMETPPYWALCWAGGQVLARYMLSNPDQIKGRSVVDFGAGSGVVAIAAAMAGAKKVWACDCDTEALIAIKENAALNNVTVEVIERIEEIDESIDIIAAADLLYDNTNLPLLEQFIETSETVLIADSRFTEFDLPNQRLLLEQLAATCPDLDNTGEYSQVSLYQFTAGSRSG